MTAPFPIGYHQLHENVSLNFQLNRFWNWVGEPAMLAELRAAAPRIRSYGDWTRELLSLSDQALAAGRPLAAAYHARAAEFFMQADDSRRGHARKRFLELVLRENRIAPSERSEVPYEGQALPAYRLVPPEPRGTIVVFGGFDSYIEEWFPLLQALRSEGLEVIAFDGPGQGGALEDGLSMTVEWGQPVKAVLDFFGSTDVSLLGFSLGGCLVMHGAAGEPRVKRVIADDILTDFAEVAALQAGGLARHVLSRANLLPGALVDAAVAEARRRSPVIDWGVRQGMRVLGAATPADYLSRLHSFRTAEVSARIDQDVLLLAGAADHYVPLRQLADQLLTLSRARSVTARIFTAAESAQNHCGVGNLGLVLKVMIDWLDAVGGRRPRTVSV